MMGAENAAIMATVVLQLMQQAQAYQAKIAAGTITDADVDAALIDLGHTRETFAADIAAAKAAGN